MVTIIMLVVMVGLIWFMQRSQRKQAQERQNQLNAVARGDEIVTIGGLYGIVDEVDTDAQKIVLDVDGVYLTFELSALKRVVNKADTGTGNEAVVSDTDEVIDEAGQAVEAAEETSIEVADNVETAIDSQD